MNKTNENDNERGCNISKSEWESSCDDAIEDCHSCETECGEGRWISTGDGRCTIKDRSND